MTVPYPDTTRTVYVGVQATPKTRSANMRSVHTMNEPAHTLQNGVIMLTENTGTRTNDSGSGRGKRASSIKLQAYVRLQELGIFLESAIAPGTTVNFPDTTTQLLTMIGVPTGGTFKLSFEGEKTGTIAFGATNSTVQSALEALSNLDPGDVLVSGSAGGPWTVTFPLAAAGLPGVIGPGVLVPDNALLTGGTNPHVAVTTPVTVSDVYQREYIGGTVRGALLSLDFFNGLYWREMLDLRVNTCNVQGSGNAMAMVDIECIGPAGKEVDAPTPISDEVGYKPIDVPMQAVYFGDPGILDADVDRLSLNINNNLTQRPTMDGTTSMRRVRTGFFTVEVDGMVDYPAYAGSFYAKMESGDNVVGALEMVMLDDLHMVGATTHVNPYAVFRVPEPLLADTTEGNDAGELVQMIKGRAEPNIAEAATMIVYLVTDKPTEYFDAA